jgi:hypothetical protein
VIPSEVIYVIVTVTNSSGSGVTGLVTGNFTVDYYLNATNPASAFTATELSGGRYRLALTLPASPGSLSALFSQSTNTVNPPGLIGEIESVDLEAVYPFLIRPISQLSGNSSLAADVTLTVNAYRYKELSVSIVDQAGTAIDLSGYNNWKFNVWTKTHSGSIYTLASGITGSAGGVVAWSIPENASFFSNIDAEITAGNDSVALYYDMIADKASDTAKTSTVFRGQLILTRFEGAAS